VSDVAGNTRARVRRSWKHSIAAIHRERLLHMCVREWREALLVAVVERVFSARRQRYLALVWVSAASIHAQNVLALRRRVTRRMQVAVSHRTLLCWALCCAAVGLGQRVVVREAFVCFCEALQTLADNQEVFGEAARRTLLRNKALRKWLSFMRRRAAVLALLLQGQELYRRHLLWARWGDWWAFSRESARRRRGTDALSSRRRRTLGRSFVSQWRKRGNERVLQRRVVMWALELWEIRWAELKDPYRYVYMYVYIEVYTYICMYIQVCIYIYIYTGGPSTRTPAGMIYI